jgi:lipopolysaccharide transport system permease protein
VSARPELVIEGRPRPALGRALRELWVYRGTMLAFAERNVRVKYKQTLFGLLWVVLQPLAFVGVFTVALGRLADVPGGGVSYAAFSLSAFVPWIFIQASIAQGANSLVTDADFLRKVYFPREVPVLASVLAATVDFAAGLALFVVIGPFLGAELSPASLLAPLIGLGVVLLAVGVSLLLGGLNVYYRDFRHALPFLLQLWLFASPVVYPITVIPDRWRELYAFLNPAAGLLDSFRRTLALGELPDPVLLGLSVVSTVVVCTLGYALFKRLEPNFADVV